jgi:hypothetical protein
MWAGARASDALLQFLGQSGRNLGPSVRGGQLLADHVTRVLEGVDPEPDAAFVTLGPDGAGGLVALLHGPVQVWTGARWIEPPVTPGWSRVTLPVAPVILAGSAGTQPVPGGSHPVLDLEAGAVPGGGFALIDSGLPAAAPDPRVAREPVAQPVAGSADSTTEVGTGASVALPGGDLTSLGDDVVAAAFATPDRTGIEPAPPAADGPEDVTTLLPEVSTSDATAVLRQVAREEGGDRPRPAGVVGLLPPPGGLVPEPPVGPLQAVPVVRGVRCARGHFNHPESEVCARCRLAIAESREAASGPRPPLGILVVDDGALYALDRPYLLGRLVDQDDAVLHGSARALVLEGDRVADTHAELRVSDWTVAVVDLAGVRSTHLLLPGSTGWTTLGQHQPAVLPPGGHLAIGSRVLTFVSPWPG